MKRSIIVIGEFLLTLFILYELYLLIIPLRGKDLVSQQDKGRAEKVDAVEQEITGTPQSIPPERVAYLFGWRKKENVKAKEQAHAQETAPEAAETKAAEKPELINWLKPVGFALDSGSVRYHFFKDERTKRVMKLSVGVPDNGWKMIEANDNEFVLEFEGKLYSVKRNP